jgi:geranylgeranyl diphosphate synthase, type I
MERSRGPIDLDGIRARVDAILFAELERAEAEIAARSVASAELVRELARLARAGGKRLRPVLCVLGHAAAGGAVEDVLPAAAGLELFHTFALVHDDVMDDEDERRGVDATHRRFAKAEPGGEAFGRAAAILAGDVALVLATDLLLSAPLPAERLLAAAHRMRAMALATAAGQYLDVAGSSRTANLAALKTGVYTAEAPLAIGAELAGAAADLVEALERFARPLGVAFQLLDDAADGVASADAATEAARLLDRATAALSGSPIDPRAVAALREVVVRLRGGR